MKRSRFEIKQSRADGKFYAHLRAPNGEIVAASEGYSKRAGASQWCLNLSSWALDAFFRFSLRELRG